MSDWMNEVDWGTCDMDPDGQHQLVDNYGTVECELCCVEWIDHERDQA